MADGNKINRLWAIHDGKVCALDDLEQTLQFPFLVDKKTVSYIRHSKVMFIMRGLPGSGKSTIVRLLKKVYPHSATCSADDYFLVDGEYQYDATQLKDAHELCQKQARDACVASIPVIVIDNTNVRQWEMKVYLDLAWRFNYVVVVATPKTAWRFNPKELASRNKHGLDAVKLSSKVQQFERLLPIYFGWFVSGESSRNVRVVAKLLFRECVTRLTDFSKELLYSMGTGTHTGSISESELDKLMKHFSWTDSDVPLHCTAMFCNKGKAPGVLEYTDRQDVMEAVGKAFQMDIVGFAFSENTVSARLILDSESRTLFDKPEERGRDESIARNASVAAQISQMTISTAKTKKDSLKKSDSAAKVSKQLIHLVPIPVPPPTGFARSAHLTIACAEHVQPKQAISDNLDICDVERNMGSVQTVPVKGGRAVSLGRGLCAVYLYRPITVSTLFSAV